jgi:hypothetical protein
MHSANLTIGHAKLTPLIANHAGSQAGRACNRRYGRLGGLDTRQVKLADQVVT